MNENGNGYRKNISNEELIALIQHKAAELGRSPALRDVEVAAAATATRRFGSWNNFLISAGLEINSQGNAPMSDEEAIRLIQAKAAELGRTPERSEFTQARTVIKKYGGWKKFLKAAGLKPSKRKKYKFISDERLIELVHDRAAELGRTPKKNEFVQGPTAARRYGSWSAFLLAANLEPAKVKKSRDKMPKKQFSDERLIELVHARAAELGRTPKRYEFVQGATAANRYGGWSAFLLAANLEPVKMGTNGHTVSGKRFSDERLIELVQARAAELGRTPKRYEFAQGATVTKRYGSWQSFLASAGLEMEERKKSERALGNKQLIELVQAQAAELGRPPQKYEFTQNKQACDRFGGWQNFLFRAGLTSEKPKKYQKLISDRQLIKAVRTQAAELGRTPKRKEFKHGDQAVARYGNWTKFLLEAKVNPDKFIRVSDERLVELIRTKTVELGQVPDREEDPYCKLAVKRYGSWQNFLKAAERMPAAEMKSILKLSNNQMFRLIKAQAEELGRTPTIIEFEYAELAKDRFHSWERFLKIVGLEPEEPPIEIIKEITKERTIKRAKISNEQLLERVQEQAAELGRTPTIREFKHARLAIARFKRWTAFIQLAGLEPSTTVKTGFHFSNEQLIEQIQAQAAELGRTPIKKEFPRGQLAIRRFGTWSAFIQSANLELVKTVEPPKAVSRISTEQLIEQVQAQAVELGRTPTKKEFSHGQTAARRFGSWRVFIERAGLEPAKRINSDVKLSNEQLIEQVQARAIELGRTPLIREFKHARLAIARFKRWTAFIQLAGLEPSTTVKTGFHFSNEQLIEQIQAQAAELGRTPIKKEFPRGQLAIRRFGTWSAFIQSANLKPAKPQKPAPRISTEEMIEKVRAQAAELGRTPTKQEFYHGQTAVNRFGSWRAFTDRAGLWSTKPVRSKRKLSNEQLIERIQAQAVALGRTPEKKEFRHSQAVVEQFGSWRAFIKKADLEPAKPIKSGVKLSNEQLIERVQARAIELGRTPIIKEFQHGGLAVSRFGNWTTFLSSAGLKKAGKYKTEISNEQLLELVKQRAHQLGRAPVRKEFPRAQIATDRFGSWRAFIERAGLEPAKLRSRISDEQLIERVQARAAELGRTPTIEEFQHAAVAMTRFGKWLAFLKHAGLKRKTDISNEELIEQVQALAAELGRTPKTKDFQYASLVSRRFGKWNVFLKEAGLV